MQNRSNNYKLLLDVLPRATLILSFFLFIITILLAQGVIYFAPQVYTTEGNKGKLDYETKAYFNGSRAFEFTSSKLDAYNFQIKYYLLLKTTPVLSSFEKIGEFEVIVKGMQGTEVKGISNSKNLVHKRPIRCKNNIKNGYFCEPIQLFGEKPINYEQYTVSVRMKNLQKEFEENIFDDLIVSEFETINPLYSKFELVLRIIYFISSLVLLCLFILLLTKRVSPKYVKTEQKWVFAVLISLCFFNFPSQALDYRSYTWIFSIIEILSLSTSCCLLVLFIMVISHSAVVVPKNRKFLSFYLPKLLAVGTFWLLITIAFGWERFNQYKDPSYSITEVPFYGQLRIVGAIVLLICIFMVVYYIARGIGMYTSKKMNQNYSNRFINFWILTILVLITLSINLGTILLAKNANNATQFLSIFPIFNYYVLILVMFFLPSAQVESDLNERSLNDDGGLFDLQMDTVDDKELSLAYESEDQF